jgi:hypothetical protein
LLLAIFPAVGGFACRGSRTTRRGANAGTQPAAALRNVLTIRVGIAANSVPLWNLPPLEVALAMIGSLRVGYLRQSDGSLLGAVNRL